MTSHDHDEAESAEAVVGVIATSVESMLPEILVLEPDYVKSTPSNLTEVGSASDMEALIDFHGTTVVCPSLTS